MQYHYLRVFAVADERFPLLQSLQEQTPRIGRTEYLQEIFGQRVDFIHRKNSQLVYVPVGEENRETGKVILGRVGRSLREVINEPPEAGFAEAELTTWRASNFLIDTGDYKDGQKIAMQMRSDVGRPLSVAESLVRHINTTNPDSGWILELSPITEPANFWAVVREWKGALTAATFNFVTPNVLGLRSQLNAGLKDARQKNNAHRVGMTLANEKGNLELEQDNIRDAVEYVSEGGGTAKLKSGKKVVYDSEKDQKTVALEQDEPILLARRSLWRDMVDKVFK